MAIVQLNSMAPTAGKYGPTGCTKCSNLSLTASGPNGQFAKPATTASVRSDGDRPVELDGADRREVRAHGLHEVFEPELDGIGAERPVREAGDHGQRPI